VLAESEGTLSAEEAAMLKWWSAELLVKVVDRCVQLHGGYGYMRDCASSGSGPLSVVTVCGASCRSVAYAVSGVSVTPV
jgi:hypothetical protein